MAVVELERLAAVGALFRQETRERGVVQIVARDPESRAPDDPVPAGCREVVLQVEIISVAPLVEGAGDVARGVVEVRLELDVPAALEQRKALFNVTAKSRSQRAITLKPPMSTSPGRSGPGRVPSVNSGRSKSESSAT